MLCLLCDDGYRLDTRRAGSDDAYAQSRKVDPLMRPETSVIPLPLETLQTWEVRGPRCRKIAGRHDTEACGRGTAFVSLYCPCVCLAIEDCLFDTGVELDVTP